MRHVSLDGYADAIKQFIRQLATEPGGSVLELEGRPVIFVKPFAGDRTDEAAAWTEEMNARRCALIDREIAGTLTLDEAVELERLQRSLRRELQRLAPLPLDDARALHQELLARAQAQTSDD